MAIDRIGKGGGAPAPGASGPSGPTAAAPTKAFEVNASKDAQKTDSKQTSKSLLLSDDAYMNSQPALEIYADDVKCTHGSTTGPVDEEAVFYLRSRGVGIEAAMGYDGGDTRAGTVDRACFVPELSQRRFSASQCDARS